MVEQYAHTLIARPIDFTPSSQQLHDCVAELIEIIPLLGPLEFDLRTVSGYRDVVNPFTGQSAKYPNVEHRNLTLAELAGAAHNLPDFEVAFGKNVRSQVTLLPMPKDTPQQYWLGVKIVVSSEVRSMSDTYNGFEPPLIQMPQFGAVSARHSPIGYFSNLHNGSIVEVEDAGSARFWIEFELGKFLFPPFDCSLELLNPNVVAMIERVFGVSFVQGCHWL